MSEQVLFVDDEQSVLDGIQRTLRNRVQVHTATSGADGLRLVREQGPFALVVADMRMPLMNGARFLAQVRELGPDTVRMILSGQADLQSTIAAVNEGHIFRFLSKPCPADQLIAAVEDGLKQHRLVCAEKVLLEQTLSGSIRMLIEILGMVRPSASSRATRLQHYVTELAALLGLQNRWEWGVAALTSQLGCIGLAPEILAKAEAGQPLTEEERRLFESHPEIAGRLLDGIPRLEDVAAIVSAQLGAASFAGKTEKLTEWDVRSAGQLLLRASIEFDRLVTSGTSRAEAVQRLKGTQRDYPAAVFDALRKLSAADRSFVAREVRLKDLAPGMILDQDLMTPKGTLLVPAGQQVTSSLMIRLGSIAERGGVAEPFRVRVAV
jgi:CheY-like chemotaxis protein